MKRLFSKNQILTIPNLLSFIRLLLIPVILWLYYSREQYHAAVAVILLSGVTDIADGFIARRFNMTSDFGKAFDPVADKLTQVALFCCLVSRYRAILWLIILFVCKELCMGTLGYIALRKGSVNSAKWHGKLNTFVLYAVMIILILFPGIPETAATALIALCFCTMILSLVLYVLFYSLILRKMKLRWQVTPETDDRSSDEHAAR